MNNQENENYFKQKVMGNGVQTTRWRVGWTIQYAEVIMFSWFYLFVFFITRYTRLISFPTFHV